ncbi:unnamed protein product [Tetraodon nigroviridis]|uniref:(spotted green pufferfish) hypothetical protein n=1 Tax=Tetraodon nigroviridis TaxID=99883 RepID=Q4SW53_TETNG|nr:unnamed protein product [Tetraodon nigroviridis]
MATVSGVFAAGKHFWRVSREKQLVSLRPALIHGFWRGLPPSLDAVDAVYERPPDHKIVFIRGSRYWLFKDTIMEEGYPRPISDFGLPLEGVDAAFVWPHNHKTYFFKERRYWRYDEQLRQMDPGYPKDSALWKGLPPQLDDAMSWSDGEATSDLSSLPDLPSLGGRHFSVLSGSFLPQVPPTSSRGGITGVFLAVTWRRSLGFPASPPETGCSALGCCPTLPIPNLRRRRPATRAASPTTPMVGSRSVRARQTPPPCGGSSCCCWHLCGH